MKNYDCNLDSICFSFYTPEEVRNLSTKEITSLISIEPVLGKGAVNGLYDSSLGSLNDREPCRNCNLSFYDCNGHFGRIEFSKLVYNPLLFDTLAKFIKAVCFYCHRLNYTQGLLESICDLSQIKDSLIKRFNDYENMKSKTLSDKQKNALKIMSSQTRKNCHQCHNKSLVFKKSRKCEITVHISAKESRDKGEPSCKRMKIDENPKIRDFKSSYSQEELYGKFTNTDTSIFPEILREHLRLLWSNESENLPLILPMLKYNNFKYPTDVFFMENMLINPPMNRLPAVMNGDQMTESPETTNMCNVVRAEAALREIIKRKDSTAAEQYYQNIREGILELQKRVNVCYDSGRHRELTGSQPGLRQKIDKKDGLFRSNIMGKRVNFACRSVISPDPTIGLDEIGVPIVFLSKLTYPEPLNPMNKDFLLQCVLNGPDVYPGAVSYQIGNRFPMVIGHNPLEVVENLKFQLQNNQTVIINRHALSGDALIMNRQPTLHRPSMQAHIIKAIHDPKAKTLRMHYSNCKAYNADFDGDEMNGHYPQSLLAQAEAKLLVNVCYQHSTPKDGSPLAGLIQDHIIAGTKMCLRDSTFTRNECLDLVYHGLHNSNQREFKLPKPAIIFPNQLWTGKQILSIVLKNSIPAGLELPNISCSEPKKNTMWRISGDEQKLKLSDVELIIIDGYICTGIFDKVHLGPSQKGLCSDLRELYGPEVALKILTNLSRLLTRYLVYTGFSTSIKDGFLNESGECARKNILNKIRSIGSTSVGKSFNVPLMEFRGEKATSLMEFAQFDKSDKFRNKMTEIDTNFKTLSSNYIHQLVETCKNNLREKFPDNNLLLMCQTGAKGGESNVTKIAIALGAIEIEGKRCPLTVGGRTLPSFKRYDLDPVSRGFCVSRFMSGLKPQELFFESMAGRDGLVDTAVKTSTSGYLQRCLIKHLEDITVCHDGTVRDNMHNIIQFRYGYDGLDVINSVSLSKPDFMEVIAKNIRLMEKRYLKEPRNTKPVLSKVLAKKIDELLVKLKRDFVEISPKDENLLREIIAVKSEYSICPNGEAVGLLAAQSVGEPSTQMTLNTFHNAGQSEMNVTLGIPRLREILMLGSDKIKTPSMDVPILACDDAINSATSVLKKFTKLYLKDIIQLPFKITVGDYYIITFTFKNKNDYKNKTDLKRKELITLFENAFIQTFAKTLKKTFKQTLINITDNKDEDNQAVQADLVNEDELNNPETEANNPEKDHDDMSDLSDIDDLESKKQDDDEEEEDILEDDDEVVDENAVFMDEEQSEYISKTKANVKAMLPGVFHNYVIESKPEPDWIKLYLNLNHKRFDVKSILLNIFENCVISSVAGVEKALIFNSNKSKRFATEGYNTLELFKYDSIFDLNKFYSNNIIKMSKLYGIEAAMSCIENEIKTVFKSYNIDVNSRHLRLIADFLTHSGKVGAFNRHMMTNHSSPLQRASFETALTVIIEMLTYGTVDYIKSPTSNIMFGQLVSNIGTNAMDLLM